MDKAISAADANRSDIAAKDCLLRCKRDGHPLAVVSIYRDVESLLAELTMEGRFEKAVAILHGRRQ